MYQATEGNQLVCIHLDQREAWQQVVRELVIFAQQAKSQCRDGVVAPGLEQLKEELLLAIDVLGLDLTHEDGPECLIKGAGCDYKSQSLDHLLTEGQILMLLELACELNKHLL